MASAQIELSNGNTLPADPAHITIVIKPVINAPPQLTLSTNALTFTAMSGNNPQSQTITITNSGGGSLTWTLAVSSPSWLSVVPVSGSIAAQGASAVTFIVNAASLNPGTYSATVVITPIFGTSETLAVALEVI